MMQSGMYFPDIVGQSSRRNQFMIEGSIEDWYSRRLEFHHRCESYIEQQLASGQWCGCRTTYAMRAGDQHAHGSQRTIRPSASWWHLVRWRNGSICMQAALWLLDALYRTKTRKL